MIDFPASPTTGQLFTASGTTWRFDGEKWNLAFTAASSIVVCSDMPPNSPSAGTLWWDSVGAQLYVWYVDPNSAEWVPTSNSGGIGDAPTDGQMYGRQASAWAPVAPTLLATNVGRNLLHNPLMNIWQRGTASVTATAYTADRWKIAGSVDTINVGRGNAPGSVISSTDEAVVYFLGNTFAGNASGYNFLSQPIESVPRLSGKTVTVSFYAACAAGSLNLGVSLTQNFGTGGSPSPPINLNGQSVVVSSTVWNRYSLTFALPSSVGKTFGTNGNDFTQLNFWYSAGSANAAMSGNVGVQSGGIMLAGIQLEIGAQATALEKPDPQQDLAKCQRFYCQGSGRIDLYSAAASVGLSTMIAFPVTMRAQPTLVRADQTLTNATFSAYGTMANASQSFEPVYVSSGVGGCSVNFNWTASADL